MGRWTFGLATPNSAGVAIAVGLALVAVIAWHPRMPKVGRVLAGLVLLAGAAALELTGCRVAQVALAVALGAVALARAVPWWLLGVPVLSVSLAAVLPSANRWAVAATDHSFALRWDLWRGSLALIQDHPWTGAGSAKAMELLNRWYLTERARDRFATCLNEPLTIAAWWGLPVAVLAVGVVAALGGGAWAVARQGSRLGAAAVAVLVTATLGGMTQGHIFAGYLEATVWWSLGIGLAIVALWQARKTSRGTSLRVAAGVAALAVGVLLTSLAGASSPWRVTVDPTGVQVARPRAGPVTGRVVIVGFEAMPRPRQFPWQQSEAAAGRCLVVVPRVEALPQDLGPEDRVVAHGEHAAGVARAWAAERTGGAAVLLTDPEEVGDLANERAGRPRSRVVVRLARGAPFVDRAAILRLRDQGFSVALVRGASAGWWRTDLVPVP